MKKTLHKLCCRSRLDDDLSDQPSRIPPQQRQPSRSASRIPTPAASPMTETPTTISTSNPTPFTNPTRFFTAASRKSSNASDHTQRPPSSQRPPPTSGSQFFAYVPDIAPTIRIVSQGRRPRPAPLVINNASTSTIDSERRPTTASTDAGSPASVCSESTIGPETPVKPRSSTPNSKANSRPPLGFRNPTFTSEEGWISSPVELP